MQNGLLTLPHGTTYRVLVLPELSTMRPEVLRKIRELVKAGATVVGPPPSRSPSLEDYPKCDEEVQELAREMWGDLGHLAAGERSYGKGRVIRGKNLDVVFSRLDVAADFLSSPKLRYTHRAAEDTDIYFVANPQPQAVTTKATFRVTGRAPELWWPDSGRIERPAVYEAVGDTVRMPLHLGPHGSVFVVFREKVGRGSSIVSVQRNETVLMDTKWALPASVEPGASTGNNNFTMAVWVKPGADTTLVRETNKGVHGMAEPRNDALFPPHGNTFGDGNHAGSGLAVGRNGVCVFEHGGNYFAPVLVHAAPITNWTHVAVVYRDGQPSVYLNGALARTGLKSDYIVHPGATSQSSGSPQFRGEMGMFEVASRALSDAEVAGLVKSMPQPSGRTLACRLS